MFHVAWKRVMRGIHSLRDFLDALGELGAYEIYDLGRTRDGRWRGIGVVFEWPGKINLEFDGYRTYMRAEVDKDVGKHLLVMTEGMGGKVKVGKERKYVIEARGMDPLFFTRVLEYLNIIGEAGNVLPRVVNRPKVWRDVLAEHGVPNMDFRMVFDYPERVTVVHAFMYEKGHNGVRIIIGGKVGAWRGFLDITTLRSVLRPRNVPDVEVYGGEHITGVPLIRVVTDGSTVKEVLRKLGRAHKVLGEEHVP